jgi:hypothetical protein
LIDQHSQYSPTQGVPQPQLAWPNFPAGDSFSHSLPEMSSKAHCPRQKWGSFFSEICQRSLPSTTDQLVYNLCLLKSPAHSVPHFSIGFHPWNAQTCPCPSFL